MQEDALGLEGGAERRVVPEIRAARLTLVDASGAPRAALAIGDDGSPSLRLFDPFEQTRAQLVVDASGAANLKLHDRDGEVSAWLSVGSNGAPSLYLRGVARHRTRAKGHAELCVDEHGCPVLSLYDKDGQPRVLLSLGEKDGTPSLSFSNPRGEIRALLTGDAERGAIRLYPEGEPDPAVPVLPIEPLAPRSAATEFVAEAIPTLRLTPERGNGTPVVGDGRLVSPVWVATPPDPTPNGDGAEGPPYPEASAPFAPAAGNGTSALDLTDPADVVVEPARDDRVPPTNGVDVTTDDGERAAEDAPRAARATEPAVARDIPPVDVEGAADVATPAVVAEPALAPLPEPAPPPRPARRRYTLLLVLAGIAAGFAGARLLVPPPPNVGAVGSEPTHPAPAVAPAGTTPAGEPATLRTLEAEEFVLKDKNGHAQARLGTLPDGSPFLTLTGAGGKGSIELSILPNQGAVAKISQGPSLVSVRAREDGSSEVTLHGAGPAARAAVFVQPDGTPVLSLADDAGRVRAGLTISGDGAPSLSLYDEDSLRAFLGASTPSASLMLLNKDGKVVFQAPR
jgi:hypothetical protein